jgi:hypothetical protein
MQVSALHRKPSSYVTHQFPNVITMCNRKIRFLDIQLISQEVYDCSETTFWNLES